MQLSSFYEKNPQQFEEFKISANNKQIYFIDKLPKRFSNVETIFLSNNNI